MPQCCAVPMCSNKSGGHKFPKDKERLKQWLEAIRRDQFTPTNHSRVCKNHFSKDDFELPKDSVLDKPRPKLKKDAVPSRFPWTDATYDSLHQRKRKLLQWHCLGSKTRKKENIKDNPDASPNKSDMHPFDCLELELLSQNDQLLLMEGTEEDDVKPELDQINEVNAVMVGAGETAADRLKETHIEYHCDNCSEEIIGFRYTCVQCDNFDLCNSCECMLLHPQHYMLRVPGPRPVSEVTSVIEAIREQIKILTASKLLLDEIKQEEETVNIQPLGGQETLPTPSDTLAEVPEVDMAKAQVLNVADIPIKIEEGPEITPPVKEEWVDEGTRTNNGEDKVPHHMYPLTPDDQESTSHDIPKKKRPNKQLESKKIKTKRKVQSAYFESKKKTSQPPSKGRESVSTET